MMKNKIGKIANFFGRDMIDELLEKFEALPKKDNGLRINANTFVEQDFSSVFREKIQSALKPHYAGWITHATIYSDYLPGGIHSDGWIDQPEQGKMGYTFLIPLLSEYEHNATLVFEETSEQAVTYNGATGLGQKGILSYQQRQLPESGHVMDKQSQDKWLPHIKADSLPFRLKEVLHWEVGSAIYWPRENLHASAWFPPGSKRKAIVVLTNE
jgi:hypothetical protein